MYTTTLWAAIIRALTIWSSGLQKRDNNFSGVDLHNSSIVYGVSSLCCTYNGHSTCSVVAATLSSTNTAVGFYSAPSISVSTTIVPRFFAQNGSTTTHSARKTNSSAPPITSPILIATPLKLVITSSTPTITSTSMITSLTSTTTSSASTTTTSTSITASLTSTTSSSTTSPTVAHIPYESSTTSLSILHPPSMVSVEIPGPQPVSTGISTDQSVATRIQSTLSTITVVPSTLSTGTPVSSTESASSGISTSQSTPSVASASPTPTSLIVVPSTLVVLFAVIGAAMASRRKWILRAYKHLTGPSQSHRTLTGSSMIHDDPADELSIRDAETPPPPYSPYQPSWLDQEIVAGSYLTGTTPWTVMEVLNEAYPIGDRGRHRST